MKKTVIVDVNHYAKKNFRIKEGEEVTIAIIARHPKNNEATYTISLEGKGAKATILAFIIDSKSDFILHTLQQHRAAETTSDLLVKSVLSGNAKFSFDGEIRVEKRAQKTDAYQRNENLLLSDTARARSDPSLEILANDVRCTHAATIGKISEMELWYVTSRGISDKEASMLIVRGFLESAISRISDTIAQQKVRVWLTQT